MAETNSKTAETNSKMVETNSKMAETNSKVAVTNSKMAETNAPYLLAIENIHSVATVVAAINRVRSDSTNQMQENILYLCLLVSWIEDPLRIFSKNHNKQPESRYAV